MHLPAGRPGRLGALPDRFRLRRPGGSIPVEVFVQRNIEFGTWLLDARVRQAWPPIQWCFFICTALRFLCFDCWTDRCLEQRGQDMC